MDKVIEHQLLLNSLKASNCFGLNKNMENISDGEHLHNNARKKSCANRDKKIERLGDQNPYTFASQKHRVIQFVPIGTLAAENLLWAEARATFLLRVQTYLSVPRCSCRERLQVLG